ncbi:response regulator [Caballeronia zhejiangensis]|uniref:response regulator n=1 Tax=Caballeronia zhejiangensis TaxID=871203 RepID=UPI00158B92C6|nr:response regulator [Caballeronia zhejiangensis]
MMHIPLQPILYPTTVFLVDDNQSYQHMLRRTLPESCLGCFFASPARALDHLLERQRLVQSAEFDLSAAVQRMENRDPSCDTSGTLGYDVLLEDGRFDQVSAIVVDYHMPEMNGLELLAAMREFDCTKILLTGVADEALAVDAFNAGIVDQYIKKTDNQFVTKLKRALDLAQARHCASRGLAALNDMGKTYRDKRVQAGISHVVAREHIAEFYWRAEPNALLMFSYSGAVSVFVAWDEEDWAFQCDVANDAGAPRAFCDKMAARKIMPIFWPERAYSANARSVPAVMPQPIDHWPGAHYGWSPIESTPHLHNVTSFYERFRQVRSVQR